jgi:hypothetical protein
MQLFVFIFYLFFHVGKIQCASGILASLICQWCFDFKLEPIFDTAQAASKNEACFKSGQS